MKRNIGLICGIALATAGISGINAAEVEESLLFGYCGDYARSLGTTQSGITSAAAAIEIPAEQAADWNGAQITNVRIGYGISSVNEVTIFLTEDLDGEPFYTQKATMSIQEGWNNVKLDTPYTVTGTPFYVGYSTTLGSIEDTPIGIDDLKTTDAYGDIVNLYDKWQNIGKFYGNVCIRLSLIGDNLPQYEVAATELSVPPIVEIGNPFTASLYISNNGVKTINEVTVSCKIDGMEVENPVATLPNGSIPSGEIGVVEIADLMTESFDSATPIEVTVLTINGMPEESAADNTATATFSSASKTYKRNVVVEEFTGLWCGNCPVGIVAMSYMRENYGDDGFIGIAVHYGDVMAVESYAPVVDRFANNGAGIALPACVIDRNIETYPATENIEYYYQQQSRYPVGAAVDVSATYSEEDGLNVEASTEFSFDYENATYALAFVIIEDNVGPYVQENYYSGGNYGGLEGWSNKPLEVEMYFEEVARDVKDTYGIPGSVPASIKAVTPYSYSTTLPTVNVSDINECKVVALLLDTSDYRIVNAAQCSIEVSDAGMESLFEENTDSFKVYNLQGVKVMETSDPSSVNTLEKGIYVVNGKKVYVK